MAEVIQAPKDESVGDNREQERLMADYENYKINILKYGRTVMTFEEYCQKDIDLFVSGITTFADRAKSDVEAYASSIDKVSLLTEQLSEINNGYRYIYSQSTVDNVIRHGAEYENLVAGKN